MAAPGIIAVSSVGGFGTAAGYPVPHTSGARGLDETIFSDINHFAVITGWLHTPMSYIADYGIVVFALLLLAGYWTARRGGTTAMAAAIWAIAGTAAAVGVNQVVSHAVAEARPWQSLPNALILAGHTHDFSFPSDHAMMAGAVTAGLFVFNRRLGIISAVAAIVLCFSRVYIGAHFPQDVVAGLLLGAAVALIGYLIVRIPLRALVGLLTRTPLRPLLTAGTVSPGPSGSASAGTRLAATGAGHTARHRAPR